MTERNNEDEQKQDGDARRRSERDLRSILEQGRGRRDSDSERTPPLPEQERGTTDEEAAPPYEPPVRPDSPDQEWERERERKERRRETGEAQQPDQPPQKLPPVWPGDEDQPWFRRERGLPPMPGQDGEPSVDPDNLPTPLAEIPDRARAVGIQQIIPTALVFLFPPLGNLLVIGIFVANLFLWRQGQDVGAILFRMRVVRENGDVAGFFQMWVRNAASIISFLALGAGYWTAFSDPERRTWHDKWLGTYVVKDAPEYRERKRSSSSLAGNWFWITLLIFVAISLMLALSNAPLPETVVPETPVPETPTDSTT